MKEPLNPEVIASYVSDFLSTIFEEMVKIDFDSEHKCYTVNGFFLCFVYEFWKKEEKN